MADSYQFPFPQKMIFIYNNIKSETTDFSKLCRCCMEDGDIGIYETDFQGLSLAAIIEFCTHTELALDEDLPKNICQQCFDQLTASYLFIAKYLKLQEYITKIADSQIREEIKIEVEQSDTKVLFAIIILTMKLIMFQITQKMM
ncbi:hypothetical protein HHI36_009243 [Cryptolaemus montrouzieri]|uniref:ZAD domain-containing protein n=1 Tax=Cryptolaemus montrouzieri TaxID=559131 RepID=A0ABD2MUU2_9CUCU